MPLFPKGAARVYPLEKPKVSVKAVDGNSLQKILFRMIELNVIDGLVTADPELTLLEGGDRVFLWMIKSRMPRAFWFAQGRTYSFTVRSPK